MLNIGEDTGYIKEIKELYAPEHLPLGVQVKNGVADRADLGVWWHDRAIPSHRFGIRAIMRDLDIYDTKIFLMKCYGLCLSDQYWICPEGSGISWDSINYFTNGFSSDLGDILFCANRKDTDSADLSSPDGSTGGNLKKRWKIADDGRRILIKGGSSPYYQQPINEVAANRVADLLGIPHIKYDTIEENGEPYSVCEDFVTENTELIPAWQIFKTKKQDDDTSVYRHFLDCCESLAIPGALDFLDKMITLDYIIMNEDRHFNNFGALRNPETLEWIGMAPIYDSGTSLGYDKDFMQISNGGEYICKPFKNSHEKQIALVSSFQWLDTAKLSGVYDIVSETLQRGTDKTRAKSIADFVNKRTKDIAYLSSPESSGGIEDHSVADDVRENIAEDYN